MPLAADTRVSCLWATDHLRPLIRFRMASPSGPNSLTLSLPNDIWSTESKALGAQGMAFRTESACSRANH